MLILRCLGAKVGILKTLFFRKVKNADINGRCVSIYMTLKSIRLGEITKDVRVNEEEDQGLGLEAL